MTGIEKIISRIRSDAEAEAEKIMAEARAKADATAADYQKKADALEADLNEKGTREAEERRRRAIGVAELEARKKLLETKQSLIDRAFISAKERLLSLPKEEIIPVLARLAAGASRTGQEEVILSRADREGSGKEIIQAANKLLKEQGKGKASLTLSGDALPEGAGGIILSGGEVEVNCTFATLLETLRGEMAAEIAQILFV